MAEMFFRGSAGWIPALDVGKTEKTALLDWS